MSVLSTSSLASSTAPSQVFSVNSASTSASSISHHSTQSRRSSQISNASSRPSSLHQRDRYGHYQQQASRPPTQSQTRSLNINNVQKPAPAPQSAYAEIFQRAMDEFEGSLGDQEHRTLKQCKTAEQFHDYITKMEVAGSEPRHLKRWLRSISNLSSRLEPYFKVVEILLQSNPRFAAFGWGAFRLVLQLASNYNRFFDKLLQAIKKTGSMLPQFEDTLTLWGHADRVPHRVRETIAQIFVKLMHFFHACLQVFVKKDGTIKTTTTIVGSLLWNPFDQIFQEFQADLKDIQDTLRDELALANTQITVEVRDQHEQLRKERAREAEQNRLRRARKQKPEDAFILQAKAWLNPPTFSEEFEDAKKRRHKGTAEWIFDDGVFNSWKEPDTSPVAPVVCPEKHGWEKQVDISRFLWISGMPGCGKTVLCASIIDELKEGQSTSSSDSFSVLYFFFSHESETKRFSSSALSAVLSQLLQQHRGNQHILDILSFAMSNPEGGQNFATHSELQEVLILCLSSIRNAYLVFDGIDECSDDKRFLETLQRIAKATDNNVRFLLLGCGSSEPFYYAIPRDRQLKISKEGPVRKDIRMFLEKSISDMVDDEALVSERDTHVLGTLSAHLEYISNGMFLWAGLVIDHLRDTHLSPYQRLSDIMGMRVPPGLDSTYKRILARIVEKRSNCVHREFIQQVFMWLTFKTMDISLEQLQKAIDTSLDQIGIEDRPEHLTAILETWCLGLVEVVDIGNNHWRPQLVHLSVTEFFRGYFGFMKDSRTLRESFPFPCAFEANVQIASTCLAYLARNLPRSPLSGVHGMPLTETKGCSNPEFPEFLQWAITGWMTHLVSITEAAEAAEVEETRSSRMPIDPVHFTLSEGFETLMSQLNNLLSTPHRIRAWIEDLYVFVPRDACEAPEYLQTWSRWLRARIRTQRFHQCEEGLSPVMLELAERFPGFIRAIRLLIKESGNTLTSNPHSIRSHITRSIESPFLVKANLVLQEAQVQARVTASESVRVPGLALEHLAHLSKESASSDKVGVLRVFPSSTFSKNQHQANFRPTAGDVSGWVAVYDIRTATTESQLLYRAEISLDAREVQDALDLAMVKAGGNGDVAKAIQLPLAIGGPDLNVISVLRKLYKIKPDSVSTMSSRGTIKGANAIPIFTVPKTVFQTRFLHNTEGQQNARFDSNVDTHTMGGPNSTTSTYEYELLLNPLGTIVVLREAMYVDKIRRRCKLSGFSLEKLDLWTDIGDPSNNIVHETRTTRKDFKISVTFNKRTSMAAFSADGSVQLWEFKPGNGIPNRIIYELPECSQLYLPDNSEDSVSFSDCGKYLTVQYEMPGTRLSPHNYYRINIPLVDRPRPNLSDDIVYLSHSVEQLQLEDRPDQTSTDLALYEKPPPTVFPNRPESSQSSGISSVTNYGPSSSTHHSSLGRRARRYSHGGPFSSDPSDQHSQIVSSHAVRSTMDTQLFSSPSSVRSGTGSERGFIGGMNRHNLRTDMERTQERYQEALTGPRSQRRYSALPVLIEKDMSAIRAGGREWREPELRRNLTCPTTPFIEDSNPLTIEPVNPLPLASPTLPSRIYNPIGTPGSRTDQRGTRHWQSPPSMPVATGDSGLRPLSSTRSRTYSIRQRSHSRQVGSRRNSVSGSSLDSGW